MEEDLKYSKENTRNGVSQLIGNIEDILYGRDIIKEGAEHKAKIVSVKLTELVTILLESTWKDTHDESIKVFSEHDIISQVFNWIASDKELMKAMTLELLSIFDNILSVGSDTLIRIREVVEPLMLLLLALRPNDRKKMPFEMEYKYIQLINNVCLRLVDDQFLNKFDTSQLSKHGYKIPRYGFLNILISYIYDNNQMGNYARDSLVICLQVSASNVSFRNYITYESDCCNILAAGLSGHYAALPTVLDITNDDWYCISRDMVAGNQEIQRFTKAVKFCCEAIHFGHKTFGERLLGFIHSGFLNSVLAAALHQHFTEAITAATAYLELFIREISEKSFMRTLLRFLLTDEYDGTQIIDTMIERIQSKNTQLNMVTLQLFKTLMDLNCEDVIYHLIIRYLIPCKHVLPNQKRTIKELDFYCKSATMFLYLTPSCCVESQFGESKEGLETDELEDEGQVCGHGTHGSKSSRLFLQSSFIECLCDARVRVRECKEACRCWSAVYDGMDVMTELPRKSGSSTLMSESKTDRSNSDVFSFALRRNSSISNPDNEKRSLTKSKSLQPAKAAGGSKSTVLNGFRDSKQTVEIIDSKECLGPFMSALYEELENMMDNSFYVNLQLTSLISRIACYPQPLLRSLLLNSNLVMQPGVKSLFQIITNVAQTTDIFVSQLDDFKILLLRAQQNLIKREKRYFGFSAEPGRKDSIVSSLSMESRDGGSSDDQASLPDQAQIVLNTVNTVNQTGSGPQFAQRKDTLYTEASLAKTVSGARIGRLHPAIRSPQKRISEQTLRNEAAYLRRKNPTAIKNAIYCAILLEEWLKELAAISLEHNLV